MIKINFISKSYNQGSVKAVDNLSLEVGRGELFGLIGPDGAGKTTLFRILTTLLIPDSGTAVVNGLDTVKDYKAIRKILGYMPGKFSLYQDLTVEENLRFFASVFNTTVEENYDLIRDIYVQIEPFRDRKAGNLSGGMKQKLALCCALIHRPEILLLDEPTTGVDAVSRKELWEMLKRLKAQGITIMVSTPYMDEAMMCERIALIQNGRIMSVETPQNIIKRFPLPLFAVSGVDMSLLLSDLRGMSFVRSCNTFGRVHHVTFKGSDADIEAARLLSELKQKYHRDVRIERIDATIEDCFIELMRGDSVNQ